MILDRIKIDGFGKFRKVDLPLAPGLNILRGVNGAGKSTLLAFVRAMLFGFEKESSGVRYEPADGATLAGELALTTARGPLLLRRVAGRRFGGEVSLRTLEGEALAEETLKDALGGVGPDLFFEVFAFGLSELEDFERVSQVGTVSEALFAAGMGAQRLPDALRTLEGASESLYVPKGKNPALNKVLAELADLQDAIARQADRPAQYALQKEKLERLFTELAALAPEQRLQGRAQEELSRLVKVGPALAELVALERQWGPQKALLESVPVDALRQLDELERQLRGSREELAELEATAARALQEQATLTPDASVDAAVAALAGWNGGREVRNGLPMRRAGARVRQEQVQGSLRDLGVAALPERLATLDAGASARAQLAMFQAQEREHAAAWARHEAEAQRLSRELARIRDTGVRLEAQRKALPAESISDLRALRGALGLVQQLRVDVARTSETVELLRAQRPLDPAGERGLLSARDLARVAGGLLLAILLAAGVGGMRAALPVAVLAALVGGAVTVLLRRLQRETASREALEATRRETHAAQLLRAEATHEAVTSELAGECQKAGVAVDAIAQAERLRAEELEQRILGATDAARLGLELAAGRERLAELTAELQIEEREGQGVKKIREALQVGLEKFLSARSLPPTLNAEHASVLLAELARAQARLEEVRVEEAELTEVERGLSTAAESLRSQAAGLGLAASTPEETAVTLQRHIDEVQSARARRKELAGAAVERTQSQRRLASIASEAESALAALLSKAASANTEMLRRRTAELEGLRRMRDVSRDLRLRCETTLGTTAEAGTEQLQALGGLEEAGARAQTAQRTLEELAHRAREISVAQGEIQSQLRIWENDDELRVSRGRVAELSAQALRLARQFAVERLAFGLLTHARRRHEKERQPAVIRRTSGLFSELTGGRYRHVVTELTSPGEVFAENDEGTRAEAGKLSRGTREQLYLAFRLALVEELADRRGPLPLLVDDILVNFDQERTELAVRVFQRFAQKHQVLAFTCHPHVVALFVAAGANVVDIADLGLRQLTLAVRAG